MGFRGVRKITARVGRKIGFRLGGGLLGLAFGFSVPSLVTSASANGIGKLVSDVCRGNRSAAFRDKYCKAAKDHQEGFVANRSSAAVWGGVSVVCLSACGKAVGEVTCQGASYAASAAQAAVTGRFVDAIRTEGTKLAAKVITGVKKGDEKKPNGDACKIAGSSALQSYEKLESSKKNSAAVATLRDQTKSLNTDPKSASPTYRVADSSGADDRSDGTSRSAATAEVCTEAALQSALGSIRCATARDPNLPAFVQSEQFLKDLASATGGSPDDFFANFGSPAKSLLSSPAMAALPSSAQQGAAVALSAMADLAKEEGRFANPTSTASKISAGRNSRNSATGNATDDSDLELVGALANALSDSIPETARTGDSAVQLPAPVRVPANFTGPEDRTVSLFDRVRDRYGAVTSRENLGVNSLEMNAAGETP